MMFPGITYSPPNFLTPRNFGFESLPFFEVPPDFFVALCHRERRKKIEMERKLEDQKEENKHERLTFE